MNIFTVILNLNLHQRNKNEVTKMYTVVRKIKFLPNHFLIYQFLCVREVIEMGNSKVLETKQY